MNNTIKVFAKRYKGELYALLALSIWFTAPTIVDWLPI